MQWVLFNLFLAGLASVGAGVFAMLFKAAHALHLPQGAERILGMAAALLAITAVFYTAKHAIRLGERLVNKRAR